MNKSSIAIRTGTGCLLAGVMLGWCVQGNMQKVMGASNGPQQEASLSQTPDVSGRDEMQRGNLPDELSAKEIAPLRTEQSKTLLQQNEDVMPQLTDAVAETFLNASGRLPEHFAALYNNSQDSKWLRQGVELFPDAPVLLITQLNQHSLTPEERQTAIEQFKKADPENPVPWLFEAVIYFTSHNRKEALQRLEEAVLLPDFRDYRREMIRSQTVLLKSMGMEAASAFVVSETGLTMLTPVRECYKMLGDIQREADGVSVPYPVKMQANTLLYRLGKMYTVSPAGNQVINRLSGYALQLKALSAIPEGSQAPYLSIPVNDRIREIEAERTLVRSVVRELVQLHNDPPLFSEYWSKLEELGEWDAMLWFHRRQSK